MPPTPPPEPEFEGGELIFIETREESEILVVADDAPSLVIMDEVTPPNCWRRGLETSPGRTDCEYCHAPFGAPSHEPTKKPRPIRADRAIVGLIWLYVAILLTSIFAAGYRSLTRDEDDTVDRNTVNRSLVVTAILELIDGALVIGTIALVRRPPPLAESPPVLRRLVWAFSIPVLVGILALNFGYSRWLNDLLELPKVHSSYLQHKDLVVWVFLLICVQPAIVEELFFRYLMIGHLRPVVGTNVAVIISGFMFGLCHLYNPMGMPLLIVIGIGFGYARVWSRSMIVPMFLHCCHNAVVTWSEPWL